MQAVHCTPRALKVLSSEMDPAEIRFVRKAFIKEKGAEVFRKIHLFPILLAIRILIANSAHRSVCGL